MNSSFAFCIELFSNKSRESTSGTAVAATSIGRFQFSMLEDAREYTKVEEQIGAFTQGERTYAAKLLGKWNMPSTPLTFEQVNHILEAGVKTATPTGTNPYTYVYAYPYTGTSVNTIKTYTIEAGSATVTGDVREMEYCYVESFEFSGKFGEAWMMQSNWQGRQLSASTFTAALTVPTVEEALFQKTTLYIDATGGTIGTTAKAGVLMSSSFKVKTGLVPVPVANGQLYFYATKWTQPEITFSITMELEDTVGLVAAERAIYEANTVRLFRLKCLGSGSKSFQIDFAGKYDKISDYNNDNGNTSVTFDGHAVASSADSISTTFTLINTLATVP